MSTDRDQEPAGTRSQFEELICTGLGYCCAYAFLRVNRRTGAIALRLGMAERTVRYWKARFKAKSLACAKLDCCMLPQIRKGGK